MPTKSTDGLILKLNITITYCYNKIRRIFMRNKEKGITLIALIITIIVMLILVGVVVTVVIQSNLLRNCKNSRRQIQNSI